MISVTRSDVLTACAQASGKQEGERLGRGLCRMRRVECPRHSCYKLSQALVFKSSSSSLTVYCGVVTPLSSMNYFDDEELVVDLLKTAATVSTVKLVAAS